MVDLFMYRDPEAKKVGAADEATADHQDGEADQDAGVADTMKNIEEGEPEEDDGDEGDEKWGTGATAGEYAK